MDNFSSFLKSLGLSPNDCTAFRSEEDGSEYSVWRVSLNGTPCVLKRAKAFEAQIYQTYLSNAPSVPRLYRTAEWEGNCYLLMEYAEGESMCRCDRASLTLALDALIALQERFWNAREPSSGDYTFDLTLTRRIDRGRYLADPLLERAYGEFLSCYQALPRTLCHDDLLPFNVLVGNGRAVLIDWEVAALLPYPTSLARLLAHGESDPNALFVLSDEDREFAVTYYYEHLIASKGISYEDYRRALDRFLFYEYCEWVMLGVKYGDTDSPRYRRYRELARSAAAKLC